MHRETPQKRVLFARNPKSFGPGEFVALCLLVLTVTLALIAPASRTYAATNPTINFQARLMNANGSVVVDGSYNVEFKLYSASSGGSTLWTEDWLNSASQGISVANGYLTANLGSITSFAGSSIPWGSPLWLTINVGGTSVGSVVWDGEMAPRLSLTAVPTALSLSSSNSSSFVSTLGFVQPTASQSLLLPVGPNSTNYVCYQSDPSCNFAPGTGASYIDNQTSLQTNANFYIQARSSTVAGTLKANGADILDLQNSSAANVVSFGSTGVITIAGAQSADITTANSASGVANGITIAPGSSGGAASAGGTITVQAGVGAGTGSGGLLTLQGGTSGTGAAANGGNIQIQGGTANGTGASNGGSIVLQGGTPTGTGVEGQIQINGGLLYATTAYSNGSSSTITQSAIDSYTTILATASASGLTFTVPSPTTSTAGRVIVISNAGSTNAFILAGAGSSFTLNTGSSATLLWNGSSWTNAGVDASTLQAAYNNSIGGSTPMIQLNTTLNAVSIEANSSQGSNQNFLSLLSPTGVQEIGFGVSGTYFQKPKVDGLDFEIQQNNGGTVSTTKDVLSVDTTAAASIVNLGSTSSGSGYNGSTVNIVTTNSANGTVNIGGSSLAGSATQTINIGFTSTLTGTTNVNIGAASPGAGTTVVRGAGGLTLTGGAASTWSTSAGALTIQGFAGVTLQTPATAIASTNSSALTIQTGNATGTTSNSGSISIDVGTATGTTGSISIGNSNASTVNVGNETGSSGGTVKILGNSITIGNSAAVARTVLIANGTNAGITQTIKIGTSSTGTTNITLGSLSGGSSTTLIQGGTGGSAISLTTAANGSVALNASAGTGSVTATTSNLSGAFSTNTFTLKNTTTNQSNAFLVQNASGIQVFTINTVAAGTSTSNAQITLGNITAASGQGIAGQMTFADGSNDNFDVTLTGNGNGNDSAYYTAYQSIVIPNLSGIMAVVQSTAGSAQTGYLNVSGGLYAPQLDAASAGTLTLGGTNATTVQVGSSTTSAHSVLLGLNSYNGSSDPGEIDGAMYYNSTMKSFRCGENGAWLSCMGGLRSANTNQSSLPGGDTVANTAAATTFSENYTIPAGDCVQGRVYRATMSGTFANASSTPTLLLKVELGATVIATSTASSTSSSANTFTWTANVNITCTAAVSASSLIEADGMFTSSANGAAWFFEPLANQAASVNTSTSQTLQMVAQWGTAATTNTITLRQFVVEGLGP